MKPIVVSAARADAAPKAVPSVSAAPPCNRCRREILPKSMWLLPLADWTAAISRPRRPAEPGGLDVASFVPKRPGLPTAAECAGHHVLHEGVGAIHRAALHRDVAAVPELVDVVLDAPVNPRLAHEIGADLGGDDLVGRPVVPWAMMLPSKFTIMPSPMESNEPSEPHMQTLAVTIRFWKALA
jgi:hypothetical protein